MRCWKRFWSRMSQTTTRLSQMLKLTWKAQRLYLLLLLTVQVLQGLVPLATAFISKELFDLLAQVFRGTAFSQVVQTLIFLLLAQATISFGHFLISPLQTYVQAELGRHLTLSIRHSLYEKLNSLAGLAPFEDPHFHNTLQVVSTQVEFAPIQAVQMCTALVQATITLISFLGVLLALSPLLALIVSVTVLPQLLVQLKLSRQHVQLFLETTPQERRASYYGQMLSWISYAKEVRLFLLGDYFLRRFTHSTQQIFSAQQIFQRRELRWQSLLALLTSVVATGSFIVVVVQTFLGRISLGSMVFYTQAVASVQETLMGMVFSLTRLNESLLFFTLYQEVLALDDHLARAAQPRTILPLEHGITFRDVSFRYNEQHPWILRHLNLFIPVKHCLALVGLNGAGKTTLVKLLTRLYDPTEGMILWDDVDIREFDPVEYRKHLGSILQDFVRYELTAQENIGLGETILMENLSEIEAAARKSGIHECLEALPAGYASFLSRWMTEEREEGDAGIDLSGGEWQKLALARMFLRRAEVLILDEPTAALDAQTEYELFRRFRELMQNRTSLLITHRFSTVRMADQIAVLDQGRILEWGSHEELLTRAGAYAKLYTMQAEGYR